MMKLTTHHRFRIPNTLAIFAAVLLLVTSVVSFETRQEVQSSGGDIVTSVKAEGGDKSRISDTVQKKRRGLNLGLPLFRRG